MTGDDAAARASFSIEVDMEQNISFNCSDIESRNPLRAVFNLSIEALVDLSAIELSIQSFFQSMLGKIALVILSKPIDFFG